MTRRLAAALIALALLTSLLGRPAAASQNSCVIPTTGTLSGLTLVQDINACAGSILSVFSGASAPSPATQWMLWLNTVTNTIEQFDGTSWVPIWTVDAANHLAQVQIGGGAQVAVASGTITDLWSTPSASILITGTTTITQLASGDAVPGAIKIACFAGALTLTQSGGGAPLNLPNGGANIITAAGDCMIVQATSANNVNVISYQRASGMPASPNAASLSAADQVLTGGANVQTQSLVAGNVTIDCGTRPLQQITNNGAFTITAPANDGSCSLLITNGATPGTVTFSGFTVGSSTGAVIDTTTGHKFTVSIWRIGGTAAYNVFAHQ
jgi:hypothetical protein